VTTATFFFFFQPRGRSGNANPYLSLITWEHKIRPKFMANIETSTQPFVDIIAAVSQLPEAFDLDVAAGAQLNLLGLRIGQSRYISLGALLDPEYRLLLKAKAAANIWDGTIPGAYAAYDILFDGTPFNVAIVDNEDMSMDFVLLGPAPDPQTLALFIGGYLNFKPEGVRINKYAYNGRPTGPLFAFDTPASDFFAGFDVGAFAATAEGN
jgi:Protein of unknown function (DUF2612)